MKKLISALNICFLLVLVSCSANNSPTAPQNETVENHSKYGEANGITGGGSILSVTLSSGAGFGATAYSGTYTITEYDEITFGGGPGQGVFVGLTITSIDDTFIAKGLINGYVVFTQSVSSTGYIGGFQAYPDDVVSIALQKYNLDWNSSASMEANL